MDQSKQGARHRTLERRGARSSNRVAWIALASLCLARSAWASGPMAQFDVPAEALPQAVIDFYRQSGVEAIYAATPQVLKLRTRAVHGRLESSVALARMLKGTGLVFTFDTPHSVIIRPPLPRPVAVAPVLRVARLKKNPEADLSVIALRPVEVTGSFIRGLRSGLAPLVYIRHEQLKRAAYPSVQQALFALPMVSLNGPREDLGVANNIEYGAGINLRGLGVGATLVLLNGRRQPVGGLTGDFVDVATIPWSAVQRIEVLPDGASALYGADAVAGVVNIIMRNHFTGAESDVRYGTAPDGRAEWMFAQLLGTRWHGGHAMMDYEYSDATPLAAAARPYAANADKTPYGGANYDSYYTNPGNVLDPFTLQPAYGISAASGGSPGGAQLSTRIHLQNPFRAAEIFPDRMAHEFYGALSQRLDSSVRLFAQGRYTERNTVLAGLPDSAVLQVPASNPFYMNPYPTVPYTLVAYSFLPLLGPTRFASKTRVYDGTAGAIFRLDGHWQMTVSESDGEQSLLSNQYGVVSSSALAGALAGALANPTSVSAFNPFALDPAANAASIGALSQDYQDHSVSGLKTTDTVANGPLMHLPAGEAKLALGVEWRTESLDLALATPGTASAGLHAQHFGRQVVSVYSQLHVPLLGAPTGARRVTLDLAGRYDHYSDFGGTFNPMAKVQWRAARWLQVRASWGRAYRAPKLDDLYDTEQNLAGMAVVSDPQSPSGRSLVLAVQGSNPHLRQETARTWTAGVSASAGNSGQLSLTYYDIDYWNRIEQPAGDDPLGILLHQSEWAAVITRQPTAAQIAAVCTSADFVGPVASCLRSQPAAIVDLRLANLARTLTRGVDIEARKRLMSAWGPFEFVLRGADVLTFRQALTPNSASMNILDTVGNPVSLRLRGRLSWTRHGPRSDGWGGALTVNYTGAYRNPGSPLLPGVPSWTTFDVYLRYRVTATRLGRTTLMANVANVLNRSPPFVDNQFGYDIYNVQALGRVASVELTCRW